MSKWTPEVLSLKGIPKFFLACVKKFCFVCIVYILELKAFSFIYLPSYHVFILHLCGFGVLQELSSCNTVKVTIGLGSSGHRCLRRGFDWRRFLKKTRQGICMAYRGISAILFRRLAPDFYRKVRKSNSRLFEQRLSAPMLRFLRVAIVLLAVHIWHKAVPRIFVHGCACCISVQRPSECLCK